MAFVCVCFSLFAAAAQAASPQIDPQKAADIRRLIELTGSAKLVQDSMTKMAEQIKPLLVRALPPGERREEIADTFMRRLIARANPDEYTQIVMPIYDKYLTREDLKGLLQFYESPLGKRFIQILPKMMAEANEAGTRWGERMAREVLQQMSAEYPELKEVH
jgi:hypothetical protein